MNSIKYMGQVEYKLILKPKKAHMKTESTIFSIDQLSSWTTLLENISKKIYGREKIVTPVTSNSQWG